MTSLPSSPLTTSYKAVGLVAFVIYITKISLLFLAQNSASQQICSAPSFGFGKDVETWNLMVLGGSLTSLLIQAVRFGANVYCIDPNISAVSVFAIFVSSLMTLTQAFVYFELFAALCEDGESSCVVVFSCFFQGGVCWLGGCLLYLLASNANYSNLALHFHMYSLWDTKPSCTMGRVERLSALDGVPLHYIRPDEAKAFRRRLYHFAVVLHWSNILFCFFFRFEYNFMCLLFLGFPCCSWIWNSFTSESGTKAAI